MSSATKLPAHIERAVAVKASCDPRTVRRVVAGEHVQPMNEARIRAALAELGVGTVEASRAA